MLTKKTVVLGITGSIAAYKAADLASKLVQAGAVVKVIMTESATELVRPITLRSITGNDVAVDMWAPPTQHNIAHISLAEAADVLVIAPATANTIAKIAGGIADDMLGCTVLATKAPIIIAPAMHTAMFQNPVTSDNLKKLKDRGFIIVEPESGRLASGGMGEGRLARVEKIMDTIGMVLGRNGDLAGKRMVVTAGGTQEPIDPVRHIGNRSSGKMGYAIAEAARDRGAAVTLIAGQTSLDPPTGIETIPVRTTAEMKAAVTKATAKADALIMAAAVSDYQPKQVAKSKIKKDSPTLTLELVRTPDILAEATGRFLKIGFAAESDDVIAHAREKLAKKNLDLIVANDITDPNSGFEVDTNKVTLISRDGKAESLPLMAKREVADKILDRVGGMLERLELPERELEVELDVGRCIRNRFIPLHDEHRSFFPEVKTRFILETDSREIETNLAGGTATNRIYIQRNLTRWFLAHLELKVRDKVRFIVRDSMKRYRLEIVK